MRPYLRTSWRAQRSHPAAPFCSGAGSLRFARDDGLGVFLVTTTEPRRLQCASLRLADEPVEDQQPDAEADRGVGDVEHEEVPAERVEVVVDFANRLNQRIVLLNLAEQGSLREVMQFRVIRDLTETSSIPATLRALPVLDATSAVTRTFEFGQSRITGLWTINGQTFDPNRIDARPRLGTTETWIIRNRGLSNHYVHIHGVDQQLVSRNGGPPPPYELMKETWNISGGQTIVLKLKFTDNVGRFVFHCHVLEHEDSGMMAQVEVVE